MSEVKDFASRLTQAVAQNNPAHFTAVVSKARHKGRIFVDYLRNRRGATAMMPYSARTRAGAPVAAPITWAEMKTIDAPSHFHVGDAPELKKRAHSRALAGWGRADQSLPHGPRAADNPLPFFQRGPTARQDSLEPAKTGPVCLKPWQKTKPGPSPIF